MANAFDIVLKADDQVSQALKNIDERVQGLQPQLDKTRAGLTLGGQDTQDGLSDINQSFESLSRFAKDNVQFIGDMVPPLKNFVGMAGSMGGLVAKMGIAGGAAYLAGKGIVSFATGMGEASENAYGLQVAAENAGMSVKDLSQLSGAMQLLGTDSGTARSSVEGLYKTFNDGLQGRNNGVLAVMNQIHAPISKNADGTANVLKTMEKLAEIFPRLTPQNQKTVADALGLDAEGLKLLREGARFKELLAKSDAVGLTVDPALNNQLAGLNRQLVETGAAWDGFKQKLQNKSYSAILSDGSVKDGIQGASDVLEHGPSPIALGHLFGFNRGNDSEMMRRALKDKDFQKTLTNSELEDLFTGQMNESERGKYQVRYGLGDAASQLQNDLNLASKPQAGSVNSPVTGASVNSPENSASVNPGAASVRNNNPWNIRYAGQSGAVPAANNFAHFPTPEAGVLAADRQLQLYTSGKSANVDHPLSTVAEIISKASPITDGNNTPEMIRQASKEMNVDPNQSLDFTDPTVRSHFLTAAFNREGNNPYSSDDIQSIIQKGGGESVLSPYRAPGAGAAAQPVNDPQALATAVSKAIKEQGMKVEVTLINGKNGERQSYTATGGKVATAMQFP